MRAITPMLPEAIRRLVTETRSVPFLPCADETVLFSDSVRPFRDRTGMSPERNFVHWK